MFKFHCFEQRKIGFLKTHSFFEQHQYFLKLVSLFSISKYFLKILFRATLVRSSGVTLGTKTILKMMFTSLLI